MEIYFKQTANADANKASDKPLHTQRRVRKLLYADAAHEKPEARHPRVRRSTPAKEYVCDQHNEAFSELVTSM